MKTLSLSTMQKTGTLQVDREGGIIKGIAAMTMGLTKESNCGQFMVDATTLAQAAEAINAHENGIQCRVTHPELTGADGFIELVGKISNAEVVGDQVKVDFALGSYASDDDKRRIFGLAEDAPEDAGLSIVSKSHDFDDVDGELCLRINSMHAVDWTGEPAANTAGMLSAQNKLALAKGTEIMNDAQMELLRSWGLDPEADEATVAEFIAQLDEEKQGELKAAGEVVAEAAEAPA